MMFLEDLEKIGCTTEGCDHSSHEGILFLKQRCHPDAVQKVIINAMEGIVTAHCHECNTQVLSIAVASRVTHDSQIIAEEGARQLYTSLCQVLQHYMGDDPSKEKEATLLRDTMDTIDRYRKHYGIDINPR